MVTLRVRPVIRVKNWKFSRFCAIFIGDLEVMGLVCFLDSEEELLEEDSEDFDLSTGIFYDYKLEKSIQIY